MTLGISYKKTRASRARIKKHTSPAACARAPVKHIEAAFKQPTAASERYKLGVWGLVAPVIEQRAGDVGLRSVRGRSPLSRVLMGD